MQQLSRGLLLLALGAAACSADCDRTGCDAMDTAAAQTGESALAGAVAGKSDVVANGCQECGFEVARIEIWSTPVLVTDAAGSSATVMSASPAFTVDSDGHYRQNVPAGFYLMCVNTHACVAVTVAAAKTSTVNVLLAEGPTRYFVGDAGATALSESEGF